MNTSKKKQFYLAIAFIIYVVLAIASILFVTGFITSIADALIVVGSYFSVTILWNLIKGFYKLMRQSIRNSRDNQ